MINKISESVYSCSGSRKKMTTDSRKRAAVIRFGVFNALFLFLSDIRMSNMVDMLFVDTVYTVWPRLAFRDCRELRGDGG